MERMSEVVQFCTASHIHDIQRRDCKWEYSDGFFNSFLRIRKCTFFDGYASRLNTVYDTINYLYYRAMFYKTKNIIKSFHVIIEMYSPDYRYVRKGYKIFKKKRKIINIPNLKHSFFKFDEDGYIDDDKDSERSEEGLGVLKKYRILSKYYTVFYYIELYPNLFNYICNRSYE